MPKELTWKQVIIKWKYYINLFPSSLSILCFDGILASIGLEAWESSTWFGLTEEPEGTADQCSIHSTKLRQASKRIFFPKKWKN